MRRVKTVDTPLAFQAAYVPGITLLLDFPFPAFPDNLGTWVELLLPLYSQLSEGRWHKLVPADVLASLPPSSSTGEGTAGAGLYIDRVLFINLKRGQIQVGMPFLCGCGVLVGVVALCARPSALFGASTRATARPAPLNPRSPPSPFLSLPSPAEPALGVAHAAPCAAPRHRPGAGPSADGVF